MEAGTYQEIIGKVLTITPQGLSESQRKAFDGVTYFGSNDPDYDDQMNDFSLPEEYSGLGPRHFKIFYRRVDDDYYLQDLEEGLGTFVKIERNYVDFCEIIGNTKWSNVFVQYLPFDN